jgi:hypothetical protein
MRLQPHVVDVFEIAGIGCQIRCRDDAFWDLLSPRYADFASEAEPAISLSVELIDPPADDVLAGWSGSFARIGGSAGRLIVKGAAFEGVFDEQTGQGRITQPPDPAAFETFLTAIYAGCLLRANGFMLHAAALVAPEGARVFFGPSGSGKTTVTALVGEGVISDEITTIRPDGTRYRVAGVPWRGSRLEGDLASLFSLKQALKTTFVSLTPAETARRLLRSVFFSRADGGEIARFLATAEALLSTVPGYEMPFAFDRSFWDAIPQLDRGGA